MSSDEDTHKEIHLDDGDGHDHELRYDYEMKE